MENRPFVESSSGLLVVSCGTAGVGVSDHGRLTRQSAALKEEGALPPPARVLRLGVFAACEAQATGAPPRWHSRVYACTRTALDGDVTVCSDANGHADTDAARADS